jgi:hypothetical protein
MIDQAELELGTGLDIHTAGAKVQILWFCEQKGETSCNLNSIMSI